MTREQGKDVTPEDCGVRDEFWEDTGFSFRVESLGKAGYYKYHASGCQ